MRTLVRWMGRHRVATGFAAGALVTLAALAVVGYAILADQRRSARVLAAALTQALGREVWIERVTGLAPSRVVLRGVRLPADRGWPVDVAVEAVEASGPLLAAARGEAAPVRVVVTRPVLTPPAAGAGGGGLEGLRQALGGLLGSPVLVDLTLTGGALASGAAHEPLDFDLTFRKGRDEARAEIVLHAPPGPPLTVRLGARPDGDRVHVTVDGAGPLRPLAPWLPAALARSLPADPLGLQLALTLEAGGRLAGRGVVRLGERAAVEADVALAGEQLRVDRIRGAADLGLAAAVAGLAAPAPRGQLEVADGAAAWQRGAGLRSARGTLRVPDAAVPPALAGVELRVRGLETRLVLEPAAGGSLARGEVRLERALVAGLDVAPAALGLRVAMSPTGAVASAELAGLTARLLGTPVRGGARYDGRRGRADAHLEADAMRADPVVRQLLPGWLDPADRIETGPVRVTLRGLAVPGLGEGGVDTEVRTLALRRPDGQASLGTLQVHATLQPAGLRVVLGAQDVRGALPVFEGHVPRLEGTGAFVRDGLAATLLGASLVGRDAGGREMFAADLARRAASPAAAGPVRLVARAPALERLAGLWPSLARTATGSATLELEAPDIRFAAFEGRLGLRVPEAVLLGGRVSVRDLAVDLPVQRGVGAGAGGGPLQVGEVIGYGVVVDDLVGRARLVDERLTLADLRYGLYSGEGRGAGEAGLGGDGPFARLALAGEGVRIEEFIAAYGIRGGTMTGLLRYDLDVRYRGGRLGADGRLAVPEGGTVTIELLDRLLQYAQADPTGVARQALANLRAFDYKSADVTVRTARDDIRVSVSLRGRERFGIFPPRVREINVIDMPLGFLARQFPSR
jgi:hypothetical protein